MQVFSYFPQSDVAAVKTLLPLFRLCQLRHGAFLYRDHLLSTKSLELIARNLKELKKEINKGFSGSYPFYL